MEKAFLVRTRRATVLVGAAVVLLAVYAQVVAQQKSAVRAFTDGDWPRLPGTSPVTKYSKLKQIDTTNVSKLAPAWTFEGVGAQQTPIVVDAVMYASTSTGVVAIDSDTGKLIWRYGAAPAAGAGAGGGRGGRGALRLVVRDARVAQVERSHRWPRRAAGARGQAPEAVGPAIAGNQPAPGQGRGAGAGDGGGRGAPCQRRQVPVARPRAAASPTGLATERCQPASS